MGWFDDYKPAMAMVGLQMGYAAMSLFTRAAMLQGMSPRVFVVYRQAIATLTIAPLAFFSRGKSNGCLGLRSFSLLFLTSLIGVTMNQNMYAVGLYLGSASIASAICNLIPAITFVLAVIMRLEKINIRSTKSIAKILGTLICVTGAISIALLRGPKLLNTNMILSRRFFLESEGENWLLGCIFLLGSSFCWSFWLILQVPLSACCPDHLLSTTWMCFFSTLQSTTFTFFMDKDLDSWTLHSYLEVGTCLYAGIIGSGVSFLIQSWCISHRGPVFSAMFNPLNTIIVTILAAIFFHEQVYFGSLIGAIAVILGLYAVLWGKSEDNIKIEIQRDETVKDVKILIENRNCKVDLEEPLLHSTHHESE